MFEALADAVEALDAPSESDALVELFALRDRIDAKVTMAAAAFEAAGLWQVDGATSMTAWLRSRAAMTSKDATRTSRTGQRLRAAPATAAAWVDGTLSSGQVAGITVNLSNETAGLWADHEAELVPLLAPLPVTDVASVMRTWKARAEATLDPKEKPEQRRTLHLSGTLDGRGELSGSFDPEGHDVVGTALRLATTKDAEGEPARTPAERRADALVDLCRRYLDERPGASGSRHRPHVNLIVDWDAHVAGDPAAGRTADGVSVERDDLRRYLCDAGVHRVVTTGRSAILDYGTTTRTVSAPMFNALVVRDGHCRWSGCDRPPSWSEAHHVWHWEDGGPTELPNLVLLCTRHHHRAHRPGWSVKLLPDATFTITTPEGRTHETRPPPRC